MSFVANGCKILIADRNRHVRDFLRRELSAEGYQVEVARDGREVLNRIDGEAPPHLLILDLEIPYLDEPEVWARLKDRQPPLPVVIHTFLPEYPTNLTLPIAAAFLEKKGDTDQLKRGRRGDREALPGGSRPGRKPGEAERDHWSPRREAAWLGAGEQEKPGASEARISPGEDRDRRLTGLRAYGQSVPKTQESVCRGRA